MTVDISKYNDIQQRLASEAIACIPEAWNTGRLTIAYHENSLHCSLESDQSEVPPAPTRLLGQLCGELFMLMKADGQQWSRCQIVFTRTPTGSWGIGVKFTYPDAQNPAGAEAA